MSPVMCQAVEMGWWMPAGDPKGQGPEKEQV